MPPRTIIVPIGANNASESFALDPNVGFQVESVYVEFDASGGGVIPELVIEEPSGQVIARKRQEERTDASASASATWALRLGDNTPTGPTPPQSPAIAAYAERVAVQSINSGVVVNVIFDTVVYDHGGLINLGTHPERFTIQDNGYYVVQAQSNWGIVAAGQARATEVGLNASIEASNVTPGGGGIGLLQNAVLSRFLAAGDILSFPVLQNSGAPINAAGFQMSVTRVWEDV